MTGTNIWNDVLSRIETKVNRHIFYTWFKPTSLVGDDGATLHVQVPNSLFRDWLTKHYAAVLDEALGEVERTGTAIVFVTVMLHHCCHLAAMLLFCKHIPPNVGAGFKPALRFDTPTPGITPRQ